MMKIDFQVKIAPANPLCLWLGSFCEEYCNQTMELERLLDDSSAVDMRFIYRIVLRSLELLNYAEKWERLVDIGLRFNAFSQ